MGKGSKGGEPREVVRLPALPLAPESKTHRDSKGSRKGGGRKSKSDVKQSAPKPKPDNGVSKEDSVEQKKSLVITQESTDGDELRKRLEEKSKKYSHLPVYNKEEERRKAEKRQAKVSKIFSSVDQQLGGFSDLTTSHMASHGITIAPSPFDDDSAREEPSEVDGEKPPPYTTLERSETAVAPPADVHTLKYRSGGVLAPRHSDVQTQEPKTRTSVTFTERKNSEPAIEASQGPQVPGWESTDPQVTQTQLQTLEPVTQQQPPDSDYSKLGDTLNALTQRMSSVTLEIQKEMEVDIPFIDHGEDDEDYRRADRSPPQAGAATTSSSDQDSDSDSELAAALAPCLNPNLRVAKIQLEVVSQTSSSSLVVSERLGQGQETLHINRKTVRRDFADV